MLFSKYKRFIISVFLFFLVVGLNAQDSLTVYSLDKDIVVTANRIPTTFNDVARTVTVINVADIKQIAAQSVTELLKTVAGVDARQRGTHGVQADISIRGAGFEQTLILVNGLKLIDPQTGHHNSNLPVHISDIAKIEILKGPGSRIYGPNAFGGVINIITKKSKSAKTVIGGSYGENNLFGTHLNVALPLGASWHRLTLSKNGSDGYRPNTDFKNSVVSLNSLFEFQGNNTLDISAGFNEKKFGANSFYTTAFPDQYEETRLFFSQAVFTYIKDNLVVKPQVYYRHHKDDFVLKRKQPAFYNNIHKTDVFGAEFMGQLTTNWGITQFGGDWAQEEIESNNLNNHSRNRSGLFLQQQVQFNRLLLSLGASAYYHSNEGWRAWPGIDLLWRLASNAKVYGSIARGFRVPTYTELYYKGGGIAGNAKLNPEESANYELGVGYVDGKADLGVAVFIRNSDNLIDYVLNPEDNIFYAQNFTAIKTTGFEGHVRVNTPIPVINAVYINYNYLDSDLDLSGKTTRYALTHFKHQFIAGIDIGLPFLQNLSQSLKMRYEDRLLPSEQTVVDTRLSWKPKGGHIFLDINNLFDEKYEEIPGVPMPGRWFRAGFEWQLSDM